MASVMRREEPAYWPYPGSSYFSRITGMGWPRDTTSGTGKASLSRQAQHQHTPSLNVLMEEQLSWLDDLLDDRDIPCKRSTHRRSASDSFAFPDVPGSFYGISDIAEEGEYCSLVVQETRDCNMKGIQEITQPGFFVNTRKLEKQNLSVNIAIKSRDLENSKSQMRGILSPMPENASTLDSASVTENVGDGISGPLACEQEQLSWLDDLLDDSDGPSRKVCHRRSASDSSAFMETPGFFYKIADIAEEEEFDCNSLTSQQSSNHSNKHFGGKGQRMSRYTEIEHLQKQQNLRVGVHCGSNNRLGIKAGGSTKLEKASASDGASVKGTFGGVSGFRVSDQETQSVGVVDQVTMWGQSTIEIDDPNLDPKRAKRTLANRQSAQRSRVRKLLYIAELERIVDSLQTEVSTLRSEIAYLEHQRVLLNLDNNAAKQRMSLLGKDKKFKDAQNEALKSEVQKLRKFYQLQLQQHEQQMRHALEQPTAHHNHQHYASSASIIDVPSEEFNKLNLGLPEPMGLGSSASDTFGQFNKKFNRLSTCTSGSLRQSSSRGKASGTQTLVSSSCMVAPGDQSSR